MFKKFVQLLKSAPYPEQLQDPALIDKTYKYWRIRTFYSIYIGYAFFYFTRKSFTFAMPLISDELGFSMAELGILGTTLYITYGVSKFFSGILSDVSNPRYFMSVGLILTGICNILFGLSASLYTFVIIWGFNGLFQGSGWPPCTKQLTYWFSQKERGVWWSLKSTSHNLGGALIPIIVAMVAAYSNWRWAMVVPGVISIICGLWLMNRLRDVPQSLGLPPVEAYKGEEKQAPSVHKAPQLPVRQIVLHEVLQNKSVWILALSYFFVYVVRTAVNDWGVLYLVKYKDYSMLSAASSIAWFEIGGFFGIIIAGWASDKLFNGRRIPYMMYSSLCLVITTTIFWLLPSTLPILDYVIMSCIGFFVFGPQLLVGLAAAEYVDKRAACTANGFAGGFAYVGAAFTGYPLGKIIDTWGWNGFFSVLFISSLATLLILLILMFQRRQKKTFSPLLSYTPASNSRSS